MVAGRVAAKWSTQTPPASLTRAAARLAPHTLVWALPPAPHFRHTPCSVGEHYNAQPTPRTRDLESDSFYTTFTALRNDLRNVFLHLPPIAVFALVWCLDLAFNAYTLHPICKDRTPATVFFRPSEGR